MPEADKTGQADSLDDLLKQYPCDNDGCEGKVIFDPATELWTCNECSIRWIIAEAPCDCGTMMKFDLNAEQWVCVDCRAERRLDAAEFIAFTQGTPPFDALVIR